MGWAHGTSHDGRDIGYGVEAECDEPDCTEQIDRGLAYLCGTLEQVLADNGLGCGKYFCGSHLFMGGKWNDEWVSMCKACCDRYEIDDETGAVVEDEDGEPKLKEPEVT